MYKTESIDRKEQMIKEKQIYEQIIINNPLLNVTVF